MQLATGVGLLVSARSNPSPVFSRFRRGRYTGGVKQVWSSRGEGWGCRPGLARKISTDRGGLSQSPPFFLVRAPTIGFVPLLRGFAQIRARLRMFIQLPRAPHQNRLEQHRGGHRA
jgi:hypothetical protein